MPPHLARPYSFLARGYPDLIEWLCVLETHGQVSLGQHVNHALTAMATIASNTGANTSAQGDLSPISCSWLMKDIRETVQMSYNNSKNKIKNDKERGLASKLFRSGHLGDLLHFLCNCDAKQHHLFMLFLHMVYGNDPFKDGLSLDELLEGTEKPWIPLPVYTETKFEPCHFQDLERHGPNANYDSRAAFDHPLVGVDSSPFDFSEVVQVRMCELAGDGWCQTRNDEKVEGAVEMVV